MANVLGFIIFLPLVVVAMVVFAVFLSAVGNLIVWVLDKLGL